LNPVLQYPEMIIHPPNLYSGYTGFTIPFAFALAACWRDIRRKVDSPDAQVDDDRVVLSTVGILLGAHWAYAVLGWGGYWGWDPGRMRPSCRG